MARLTGAWSLIPGARAWETVVDRHAATSIQMFTRIGKSAVCVAILLQVRQLVPLVLRPAAAMPGQLFG